MKVHFITSRPTLENDINILREIMDIIQKTGHEIAYNWIEGAYDREIKSRKPANSWRLIYKQNLEAIAKSDVVIAEASYENFAIGYQIATAIQHKKPVLLLRHPAADKNAFVTGVEDGWVKHQEYTEVDLKQIVEKFISDNDIKSKDMRFNFFIDRKIYNYLRWAAFKTGKTKAEILRDLVQHEIDKQDIQL